MDTQNLVHMANKIGIFFEAMPDPVEAQQGIADHLRKFWEPRMRRELLTYLDTQSGGGLRPLVISAIEAHRSELLPRQ